jgi:hypothetical protein
VICEAHFANSWRCVIARPSLGATLALMLTALPCCAQEGERRNEIAAVVAGTWDDKQDETFPTVGLEYGRRIKPPLDLGAEVEYVFDAERWIVAVPLTFWPAAGMKLFAGPGFERAEEAEREGPEEAVDRSEGSRDTQFLLRLGVGYAVELAERYSIGPTLSVDLVREHGSWTRAVVFGLTVGVGF